MPQQISDAILSEALQGEWDDPLIACAFMDLYNAREQLKTLKTYGEAKYAAETRLTKQLAAARKEIKVLKAALVVTGNQQLAGAMLEMHRLPVEEALKIAVEALGFYGNPNNYDATNELEDPSILPEEPEVWKDEGLKARTALDRIKGDKQIGNE